MGATCGCAGDGARVHDHEHGHLHELPPADSRTVTLQARVLAKNDDLAAANRRWLAGRGVTMLNLMSSPGAGKTTLLERTVADTAGRLSLAVIEGDQETALDADRITAAGCRVVQINTGAGCHLDAEMVGRGLAALDPAAGCVVLVENVGNLVCPALFDLGEVRRVVLACVTEGADKPMKYPAMFRRADLILVTKSDLLPHLRFDLAAYRADLARVSPSAQVITLSAESGEGLDQWYAWLAAIAA